MLFDFALATMDDGAHSRAHTPAQRIKVQSKMAARVFRNTRDTPAVRFDAVAKLLRRGRTKQVGFRPAHIISPGRTNAECESRVEERQCASLQPSTHYRETAAALPNACAPDRAGWWATAKR